MLMHVLCGGQFRVPVPSTVSKYMGDLRARHDEAAKALVKEMASQQMPMCSLEVDLWEDPKKEHWLGTILHGVSEVLVAWTMLLDVVKLGVAKTAMSQAQRIRWVFSHKFGVSVEDVVWVISSDNICNSASIARNLGFEVCRNLVHRKVA